MKKGYGLIVLAVCSLLMLAGCGDDSAKSITLVSGDKCNFVVVGDAEKNYVSAIAEKTNAVTGVTPEIYSVEEAPTDQVRIVVGNPEEAGADELVAEVPYFGYLMRAWEGDIYILAYDDDILVEAVTAFLGEFGDWYSNGKMKIRGDYMVSENVSEEFSVCEVPYLEGGENAGVYDCDDNHQMVLLEGVEQEQFEAYCQELASNGYTLYSENEINGNLFKTYSTDEGIMLHAYWIDYFKEVRIIVAKTSLLPINSQTSEGDICTPLLHQMECSEEEGYIIRLADGRFLIFDGGRKKEANADAIYTFLKENAPNPDQVVIAAWYITHAHSDHGGGLMAFAEKYGNDSSIQLESILFNPCDTSEQMKYSTSVTLDLKATFATYYPDTPVYKPLTGQVYTFGKTTVEILYTMSDYLPQTIPYESDGKGGDYNNQSMVSIVDIDSTADLQDRFFLMGDATTITCNELCYRYGDYMKSDYVQVAHHGLNPLPTGANCRRYGGTVEVYSYIKPTIALWPTNAEKVKERLSLEANDYLASIVQEIVIAGDGARTFEIK